MDPMQREFTQLQRVWTAWLDDSILDGSKAASWICLKFVLTVIKFSVNILQYIYLISFVA